MQITYLVLSAIFATLSATMLVLSKENRAMWGFSLAMNLYIIFDIALKMAT
jgi:hypothetical protein